MALVEVKDLKVHFKIQNGWVKAVDGVSFSIDRGETMGLVGESGCGKTTAAYAITQLLPTNGYIKGGYIFFKEPAEVTALREEYDRKFMKTPKARKKEIASVEGELAPLQEELQKLSHEKDELEKKKAGAIAEVSKKIKALSSKRDKLDKKRLKALADLSSQIETITSRKEKLEKSKSPVPPDLTGKLTELTAEKEKLEKTETPMPPELENQLKELAAEKERLEAENPVPAELTRQKDELGVKVRGLGQKLSALTYSYDLLSKSMRKDGSLDDYNEEIRKIRWTEISMIFQGAMNAFNPVFKIGDQITEAIQLHEDADDDEARRRAKELFEFVGISPDRIDNYPHEFSGGMKQRAMIALALALNPSFIIADEPTTALDVITQDRILVEIQKLQDQLKMAMMIITHDVSVVAEVSDKIGVMYAGLLMERGETAQVFRNTAHPYTAGLLGSFPSIKGKKRRLISIPGFPPDLVNPPSGCPFHPRCQYVQDRCSKDRPEGIEIEPGHVSFCHFARELWDKLRRTE
jgi:peptide/nickel transport system ATP-binding protein